jgi:hypothetical protein
MPMHETDRENIRSLVKPVALIDPIDLQRPTTPANSRRFVWVTKTQRELSLGIVINRGVAVIVSMDDSFAINQAPYEARISVSDEMEVALAMKLAEARVRRWFRLEAIGANDRPPVKSAIHLATGNREMRSIHGIRDVKSDNVLDRIEKVSIPFDGLTAMLNADTRGVIYPYAYDQLQSPNSLSSDVKVLQ